MGAYFHGLDYSRGIEEDNPTAGMNEGMDSRSFKKSWPLWQKLAVIGILLIIILPLSVGLAVRFGPKTNNGRDSSSDVENNSTGIWQPEVGDSWQIVLLNPIQLDSEGAVTPDVKVWDLDLYDNDASTFHALQRNSAKVICYFSGGSWENWRDDKDEFHKSDLGKYIDGWPDERWLNVRSDDVRKIMKRRIAYAAKKGCNAIDPDNIDGFVSFAFPCSIYTSSCVCGLYEKGHVASFNAN
jgi:hypothetical protein